MPAKFTNNATATLAASITTSSTSITVTTGQGALFPALAAGEFFYATLVDSSNNIEIIKVTARTSDTMTATRGQDGTAGRAYAAGDKLELRPTAATLNNFVQLDAANAFTGNNTHSGVETFSGNVTFAGTNTHSGAETFNGAVTFAGTPTAAAPLTGDNSTKLSTTSFVWAMLQYIYPIGSIYTNASDGTNPGTLFGFGTWVAFGAGRVPVGYSSGDALFGTVGNTGGSRDAVVVSHNHTITDPGHHHTYQTSYNTGASGPISLNDRMPWTTLNTGNSTTGITVDTAGVSGTNQNLQPYVTVYMWRRTA